jgi:hypothetical protein
MDIALWTPGLVLWTQYEHSNGFYFSSKISYMVQPNDYTEVTITKLQFITKIQIT